MIIHCISDLHGYTPDLPGGDLLIVAGDMTLSGGAVDFHEFVPWLEGLNYRQIVTIAGNHDKYLAEGYNPFKRSHYLLNSGCEVFGIKIWGSPYTPTFNDWYFMKNRGKQIKAIWNQIPEDIDILVTHGPPEGILDKNRKGQRCGCLELRKAVARIRPKFHVYGHIHEEYGQITLDDITYINCSYLDEDYEEGYRYQTLQWNKGYRCAPCAGDGRE